MRVLGVDPGVANTGYGIVDVDRDGALSLVDSGVINTSSRDTHGYRLKKIYDNITKVINKFKPDIIALENIYYSKNLKSLVEVSEAIGVVTLAAFNSGLDIKKFTPLEVKSAVTGFGKASKSQVQLMVRNILGLNGKQMSSHIADAIAVAICYKNIYI